MDWGFSSFCLSCYTEKMTALKHAVLLTMSVLATYLFLQVPALKHFALQVFALLAMVYILLQHRRGPLLESVMQVNSAELALINSAILLLIGSSGSLDSAFFVLTFVQLFFVAMAAQPSVALLMALEIAVFHFSLTAGQRTTLALSMADWTNLAAIPLVMVFYLFAKIQTQRAYYRSFLLDAGERELLKAKSDDQAVDEFVQSLLNKRLPMLEFLLSFPEKNKAQVVAEMKMLKADLNLLLRQINKKSGIQDKKLSEMLEQVEQELQPPKT